MQQIETILSQVLTFLLQLICFHPRQSQIRRTAGGRLWVECMVCGSCSPGISLRQGAIA